MADFTTVESGDYPDTCSRCSRPATHFMLQLRFAALVEGQEAVRTGRRAGVCKECLYRRDFSKKVKQPIPTLETMLVDTFTTKDQAIRPDEQYRPDLGLAISVKDQRTDRYTSFEYLTIQAHVVYTGKRDRHDTDVERVRYIDRVNGFYFQSLLASVRCERGSEHFGSPTIRYENVDTVDLNEAKRMYQTLDRIGRARARFTDRAINNTGRGPESASEHLLEYGEVMGIKFFAQHNGRSFDKMTLDEGALWINSLEEEFLAKHSDYRAEKAREYEERAAQYKREREEQLKEQP